ncbi:MAG: antibiotic biosynthesis monooxygenase [Chitinophagales bacterium]|nr:antibiotic biosynthesis monooxygenase [Bacteroidota bacterium]
MKCYYFIFLISITALWSCNNSESEENIFVLVKYKTQQNKNVEAVSALNTLISEVEKEDHFIQINMYVDPNDNSNILLSEQWDNEDYYKTEHMKTEQLQNFIEASSNFLAGPPEISFWKLNSSYK